MSRQPLSRAAFLARMAKGRAKAAAKRKGRNPREAIAAVDSYDKRNSKTRRRQNIREGHYARKRRRAGSAAERNAAHVIIKLGEMLAIEYRHNDGKAYRHTFKKGATLGYFRDGNHLAITPVRIVSRNGKPFIGD